jgi:hypothetical protein
MATIIKHKNTGKPYFYCCLFSGKEDVCEYRVFEFNGIQFTEKESVKTNFNGYKNFLNDYDIIGQAPPEPIIGTFFNASFWKKYFDGL